MRRLVLVMMLISLGAARAVADPALVAVASNFLGPARVLAAAFEAETGEALILTSGSSGAIHAQIANGAPFALFLSADAQRPESLEAAGLTVAGSRIAYARGQLVLWVPGAAADRFSGPAYLAEGTGRLAMADPALAPFGAAAAAVLGATGTAARWQGRIVLGQNVAQAHAFVATGNARAGFLAASLLPADAEGGRWTVPEVLHPPIIQDMVLIAGRDPGGVAARFHHWLQGPAGRAIIAQAGYGLP